MFFFFHGSLVVGKMEKSLDFVFFKVLEVWEIVLGKLLCFFFQGSLVVGKKSYGKLKRNIARYIKVT